MHSTQRTFRLTLLFLLVVSTLSAAGSGARAQMISGSKMQNFNQAFKLDPNAPKPAFAAELIDSTAPGNVLWPLEQASFTFQVTNLSDQPLAKAKVDVIAYGTRGIAGDIWKPDVFKIADVESIDVELNVEPRKSTTIKVTPKTPEKFGAYALVMDVNGGRQFVTTYVRTFAAANKRLQHPKLCLDMLPLDVLKRLGVQSVRVEISYKRTTTKDFQDNWDRLAAKLKDLQAANISVLAMIDAGEAMGEAQPLGRPRPYLDANGVMLELKSDMAWLPQYDEDFQKYCKMLAGTFGWPKGPIDSFILWNEPWEGSSIAGWGADMERYREMYAAMAKGIEQARAEDKADVLVGGCDSSSNAFDKLFGDGNDMFLKWFDFNSIHYQGLSSFANVKMWVNRKGPNGRVKIWDTESWVANTDDRVASVVAADRAAGYDRAMGVFHGNIATGHNVWRPDANGVRTAFQLADAWSVSAAVGAAVHFIGERDFKELLFKNGLPWVMLFDGAADEAGMVNPEDGTIVVVGDIGEEFGHDYLLFRTACGLKEIEHKAQLKKQLAALAADANAADRADLVAAINKHEVLSGSTMTLNDGGGKFSLFDPYGNPVPAQGGKIAIPLDGRGFFLRANGQAGSFAAMVQAVKESRVEGIEPLATAAHDLLARVEQHPTLRLTFTNVLNRPVAGKLKVTLGGLTLDPASQDLAFAANETKDVEFKVADGKGSANNSYPLAVNFDAGKDGRVLHEEDLHVNLIAKRTIHVDGNLADWEGVLPQTVSTNEAATPTLMEAAWLPFQKFDTSLKKGLATAYLAYDDTCFYFAAKVADTTPDDGMPRFETQDANVYYYPQTCQYVDTAKSLQKREVALAASRQGFAPVSPEGDGKARGTKAWAATVQAYAIDLQLPEDKLTQVALYFLDSDADERSDAVVTITPDPNSSRANVTQRITKFGEGKYVVLEATGNVRLRIEGNKVGGAPLAGIFFDPAKSTPGPKHPRKDPKAGTYKAGGVFLDTDEATHGDWKNLYGKDGYHVIGTVAKYPDYAKVAVPDTAVWQTLEWPAGVRRYSYRMAPQLPSGNAPNHDNVQIGFNVLSEDQKLGYANPPGTMPKFGNYWDTDYEYALNPVAERFGGGTEIWRLNVPGMPHKHFYPRQGRSPLDGPVKDGKLVITRDETTRLVECSIPWTEIPDVKKCLDAGKPIKFTFRVNDNAGVGCLELSRNRSVAKRNNTSLHADWAEHWSNELEFMFEK